MNKILIPICPACGLPNVTPWHVAGHERTEAQRNASRRNGSRPVHEGRRPRGRPRLKPEAIAEVLGVTPAQVEAQLARNRAQLAAMRAQAVETGHPVNGYTVEDFDRLIAGIQPI